MRQGLEQLFDKALNNNRSYEQHLNKCNAQIEAMRVELDNRQSQLESTSTELSNRKVQLDELTKQLEMIRNLNFHPQGQQ